MEQKLTATELARNVGDVLGRIRYRGDSFVIERNGEPVARIGPLRDRPASTLREAVVAWLQAGEPEPGFAEDLERVAAEDLPPAAAWES